MLINILLLLVVLFATLVLSGSSTIIILFSLLGVYILLSLVFVILGLDFLGSLLLIMYVSAVGILFIFVIMLVSDKQSIPYTSFVWRIPLLIFIGFIFWFTSEMNVECCQSLYLLDTLSIIDSLGRLLYSTYLFEVLVVGILCLLVVIFLYITYSNIKIF